MRSFFEMTEPERRGGVAGINLFFAALLGANLGTIEIGSISEHVYLSILIAGAVSGLFIAAVSSRRSTSIGILVGYAILLSAIVFVPGVGPAELGRQLGTLVATLAVWTGFLLSMRFMPVMPGPEEKEVAAGNSIGMAESRSEERAE